MKKTILSLFLLTGLFSIKANAQMAAATPVKYDVSKEVTVNMEQFDVWEALSNPEFLTKASNGYVKSITITDAKFPVQREVTFADNSKRKETIKQIEQQHKLMVIQLGADFLPKGVKQAEIVIFTKAIEDKCQIIWKSKIDGNSEGKKALMEKISAEFDSYALGFEKLTKKAIPATRMN